MQVGKFLMAVLVASMFLGQTSLSESAPAKSQHATYVRVCKNQRGQLDRRACHGKNDPARSVLAFNAR